MIRSLKIAGFFYNVNENLVGKGFWGNLIPGGTKSLNYCIEYFMNTKSKSYEIIAGMLGQ